MTCFVARRFHDNSVTSSEIEAEKKKHEGLTRVEDEEVPETPAAPDDVTDDGSKKSPPDEISPTDKSDKKTFVTRGGIQVTSFFCEYPFINLFFRLTLPFFKLKL